MPLDTQYAPPLVTSSGQIPPQPVTIAEKKQFARHSWQTRWTLIAIFVTFCMVLFYFKELGNMLLLVTDNMQEMEVNGAGLKSFPSKNCLSICSAHSIMYEKKWGGGDPLDTATLLRRTTQEKEKVIASLKKDYNDFPKIFQDASGKSVGQIAFESASDKTSTVSKRRFVRKLKMKVLSVQLAVQEETKNFNSCDCSLAVNTSEVPRQERYHRDLHTRRYARSLQTGNLAKSADKTIDLGQLKDHYARFVWANGGHSASAGHGNFFDESYTAVMERSAKDLYASVGIDFEGRNYAMGGMDGAPELALCTEAVYGLDADIISWDFGMTDGRAYWKKSLYGSRVGVHPNRPLLVDFGATTGGGGGGRRTAAKELEEAGLGYMTFNLEYWNDPWKSSFPDMTEIKKEEVSALPEFVRHFRCGDLFEKGDPLCGANKYTPVESSCKIPGRVSWHPGWKAHALQGNMMALFMIELLVAALEELGAVSNSATAELLKLKNEESSDYELFSKSAVPPSGKIQELETADAANELNRTLLFRGRAICHTAILPAETRYLGILTERENSSYDNFDKGFQKKEVNSRSDRTKLALVQADPNPRARLQSCPKLVDIDTKDYFFAQSNEANTTLVVPNKAERKAYLADEALKGIILVCFAKCDWGHCPKGNIAWEEFNADNATMFINDIVVTKMDWMSGCSILRNEQGYVWKADDRGQYALTVNFHEPSSFTRISSVILL